MKKVNLKSFFALGFAALSLAANAQIYPPTFSGGGVGPDNFYKDYVGVQLQVTEPASIARTLVYTIANDGSGAASEWGGAITSPIIDKEVMKAPNPSDSIGCLSHAANSMNGKAAFIFRGDCEFGDKALKAQQAGADLIIIVNHTAGGPVGMGAGAVGNQVTIPVVMISKEDGEIINARLNASETVKISFTTWGFGHTNDLAILPNGVSVFHAFAVPRYQLVPSNGNPVPYKGYDGAFIANLGAVDQSQVKLKSVVTFAPADLTTPVVVREDSIEIPGITTLDSVVAVGMQNSYDLHPTAYGRYDVTYTVSSATPDDYTGNNVSSYSIYVTEDVFSKSRYDIVKDEPVATLYTRFAGNPSTITNVFGNLYYNAVGNHKAMSSKFSIFKGADVPTLENTTVNGLLFKWVDSVFVDSLVEFGELQLVGFGTKQFSQADSGGKFYEIVWSDPITNQDVVLEDNSWYYVAIEVPADASFGFDGVASYFPRTFLRHFATPQVNEFSCFGVNGDNSVLIDPNNANQVPSHFLFDAGDLTAHGSIATEEGARYSQQRNGFVPAISLKVSPWTVSVGNTAKTPVNITLYPNPATESVNVALDLEKKANEVVCTVLDLTGKRFVTESFSNIQNDKVSVSLNGVPNGVYLMYITIDGKTTARQFSVVR